MWTVCLSGDTYPFQSDARIQERLHQQCSSPAVVTASSGLSMRGGALKYGGPLVADFVGEGTYDLVRTNHVDAPVTVDWGRPGKADNTAGSRLMSYLEDIHGLLRGILEMGQVGATCSYRWAA